MPHTKSQKLISWKVLDRYKTSRGIAAFLRKNKIKGLKGSLVSCPLAEATGWKVNIHYRISFGANEYIPLTDAQRNFVKEFDSGEYSYLRSK